LARPAQVGNEEHPLGRLGELIHTRRRTLAALAAAYYGVAVIAMLAVAMLPSVESSLRASLKSMVSSPLTTAYAQGDLPTAIALTFYNNLFLASLVAITLPSLAIPFWGVGVALFRAALWGVVLSPAEPSFTAHFVLQLPTFVLEGMGYVLASFAVLELWRGVLAPGPGGAGPGEGRSRGDAYVAGIRDTVALYAGVAALLAVAAAYEAIAAVLIAPSLGI
jgi:Stage II sporulation protein M